MNLLKCCVFESKSKENEDELVAMGPTDEKRVIDAFKLFDKESTGQVRVEHLGAVLRFLALNPTDENLERYIKEQGLKPTGTISLAGVLQIVSKEKGPFTIKEMRAAFCVYDKNRDGYITIREFSHALKKVGYVVTDECARMMVKEAEADGIGNGFVSFDDFRKIVNFPR